MHAIPDSSIRLPDLLDLVSRQNEIDWQPFFPGVEIHRLYGEGFQGPSASLIRFRPGARVPLHEHMGYEHILVLQGEQVDENGSAGEGGLIINPPGTRHSIVSKTGCIVLAIYETPVKFLQTE